MKTKTLILSGAIAALMTAGAMAKDGRRGEAMFKRADANGDGQISRAEAEALRDAMFARADANGDGQITRAEMTGAMQRRAAERVTKRFEKMDANRDGAIQRAEFEDRGAMRFEAMDANDDGVVTRDEIREMRHKRRGG